MSNVITFPNRHKEERNQVTELKECLVEEGIFNTISEIPTHLVIFMLQYWQSIYDAGYVGGKYEERN